MMPMYNASKGVLAVLVKPDGNARVMTVVFERDMLLTFDVTVSIECGDIFEYEHPDGKLEHFEVEQVTHVEESGSVASHYECRVRGALLGMFGREVK